MTGAESSRRAQLSTDRPISIAILAMGGQGGGVLSDWIVAVAEAEGWAAQSTSVPGVAQRTGATIYYIEMLPRRDGREPIFALMPSMGDVDIVLAAEWMEAGRSILRGLVTPEKTTVIASTHRAFAIQEKEKPGNGVADSGTVTAAGDVAAKRIIRFDMQAVAERNGTVISATMFGALAAAGALPFPRQAYENAITAGGKGAEPSLRGFAAAFDFTRKDIVEDVVPGLARPAAVNEGDDPGRRALFRRIAHDLPLPAQAFARAGVDRLVGYQDIAYAEEYLGLVAQFARLDQQLGGPDKDYALSAQAAKYIAVAMSYDDVIRVADLKTRKGRFDRIRVEMGAKDGQILYTTEYMHPRMEEVLGLFPAKFGRAVEAKPRLVKLLDRFVNRGRRVRTGTVMWFLGLYVLAGAKGWRRGSLRHQREWGHIALWLQTVTDAAATDYDLAVEALACRRLVKGYSDTHARGLSKFDKVLAEVSFLTGRPQSAAWLRRLKEAALSNESDTALEGALQTMQSAYD